MNVENTTEDKIKSCLSVYKKVKWKGRIIRVEYAKPNYMERLERRWERERALEEKLGFNSYKPEEKPITEPKLTVKSQQQPINDNGVVILSKNLEDSDDDDEDDDSDDDNMAVEEETPNGEKKDYIDEIYNLNKEYDYFHLVKEEDEKIYEVAETKAKKGGFRFLPDRSDENEIAEVSDSKKRKSPSEDSVITQPIPQIKAENKFIPIFSFMFAEPRTSKRNKNDNKAFEKHLKEIVTSGDSFRRLESLDEVKEQWKSTRSFLRKDAKKKHKHSVKKIRSLQIKA